MTGAPAPRVFSLIGRYPPAKDIHTLCTECGNPSCKYMYESPTCVVCGKSRLDVAQAGGFTVYQAGKRLVCGRCLEAEARAEKRREKVAS